MAGQEGAGLVMCGSNVKAKLSEPNSVSVIIPTLNEAATLLRDDRERAL